MMDSTDMSTPVTRGELQEILSQGEQKHWRDLRESIAPLATRAELHQEIQAAIAPLATRAELHQEIQAAIAPLATKAELHQEIQAAIAPLATKAELEMWGGALVARMQHGEQRINRLEQQSQQFEQRVVTELARHTSAILEAMRTEIKACIEPLADLPGRMSRVEAAVFDPEPRARRTRRRKN